MSSLTRFAVSIGLALGAAASARATEPTVARIRRVIATRQNARYSPDAREHLVHLHGIMQEAATGSRTAHRADPTGFSSSFSRPDDPGGAASYELTATTIVDRATGRPTDIVSASKEVPGRKNYVVVARSRRHLDSVEASQQDTGVGTTLNTSHQLRERLRLFGLVTTGNERRTTIELDKNDFPLDMRLVAEQASLQFAGMKGRFTLDLALWKSRLGLR